MASAETEDEVNRKLGDLLYKYGWTKREDDRWQCGKHDMKPVRAQEGFAQALIERIEKGAS